MGNVVSYYDRVGATHDDGSPIFQSAADRAAEARVMARLSEKWRCEIHSFGELSPVDWYATRYGRLIGVLEGKSRSHPVAQYPTVFLNCRKWMALQLAAAGFGIPAIFVVEFTDSLCWIPLSEIAVTSVRVAGCSRVVKSSTDREPVIDVPVRLLRHIR